MSGHCQLLAAPLADIGPSGLNWDITAPSPATAITEGGFRANGLDCIGAGARTRRGMRCGVRRATPIGQLVWECGAIVGHHCAACIGRQRAHATAHIHGAGMAAHAV
jgi:hypothetical protein